MEYLLKVSAVIAIFYLGYTLLLRRDTFFKTNRWFLLLGLVSSFIIPFIVVPVYIEYTPVDLSGLTINEVAAVENIQKPFTILDYVPIIYGLGVCFFSARFMVQLVSLSQLILKNKRVKKGNYTFIETQAKITPFSFFKWIVYNPNPFSPTELTQIIAHEKTHARQYHSIDILLTHLGCIALWFNPFMWLYNKDLKQNLEFIADGATVAQNKDKKSYQYTLLKTSMSSHQMALSNPFYNSSIKKRIVMLHKSKSKKINLLKYALVLPALVSFLMGFNTKDVFIKPQKDEVAPKSEDLNNQITEEYKIIITKDFSDADFAKVIDEAQKKGITLTFNNIIRNTKNEIIAIDAFYKSNKGTGTFNLNGQVPIQPFAFIQNENGFGFGNMEGDHLAIKQPFEKEAIEILTKEFTTTPLFLIDGKEVSEKDFNQIDPSQIEHISTIKGNDAIKAYGNKAKNGVIEVRLKKHTSKENVIQLQGSALYIVDGKETNYDAFTSIPPDTIESIDVLKGEVHTKEYGETGKNGVILITTKENSKSVEGKPKKDINVIGYQVKPDSTSTIRIGQKLDVRKDKHPLIILDGKEIPNEGLEKLNPNTIESLNVLKDKNATEKYGDKGKNGVIEIILKK